MTEVYAQPDGRPVLSTGFLPDGRILVATKHGDITLLVETNVVGVYDSVLYMSLRADTNGGHELGIENGKETGLMTMVLDPEFARTGHIYMYVLLESPSVPVMIPQVGCDGGVCVCVSTVNVLDRRHAWLMAVRVRARGGVT